VKDGAKDAYEQSSTELASRAFGERWGRHCWTCALCRVADPARLHLQGGLALSRLRDRRVQRRPAYDRFIREQVRRRPACPPKKRPRGRAPTSSWVHVPGARQHEPREQDKKQLEMDVVDEQLDTLGRAFLAQTIGCARCHDHKFDPIPTKDYYGMAGILKEHADAGARQRVQVAGSPAAAGRVAREGPPEARRRRSRRCRHGSRRSARRGAVTKLQPASRRR